MFIDEKEPKTYEDVKTAFIEVLCEQFGLDYDEYEKQILKGSDAGEIIHTILEYYAPDSLDTVEITLRAEKKFKIYIPDEVARNLDSVSIEDITEYICARKNIPCPKKTVAKVVKKAPEKTAKPITLKTSNETISFIQDGKTLPLNHPQISPYVKMLQDALINKR